MPLCVSCSTELDPQWKYCVACGTPVVRVEPRPPVDPPVIPGAIRPVQSEAAPRVRTIPMPAVVVIGLAAVGGIGSVFVTIQWLS